jgi:hypothetical protein
MERPFVLHCQVRIASEQRWFAVWVPVIFLFIRHKKGAKLSSLVGWFGPGGNA